MCQVRQKRLWTGRLILEFLDTVLPSYFVTLTYDDEHCPPGYNLCIKDYQDFLKRLRAARGVKFRYLICGEYGDTTRRPHYHMCLFGYPVEFRKDIDAAWGLGFTKVDLFSPARAAYCAGYVVKKIQHKEKFPDRVPEFRRMSLRPGIGAGAVDVFGNQATSLIGSRFIAENGDVISGFRFESKMWPLGRYLRGLLREQVTGQRKLSDLQVQELQRVLHDDYMAEGLEVRARRRQADFYEARAHLQIVGSQKESKHETI